MEIIIWYDKLNVTLSTPSRMLSSEEGSSERGFSESLSPRPEVSSSESESWAADLELVFESLVHATGKKLQLK